MKLEDFRYCIRCAGRLLHEKEREIRGVFIVASCKACGWSSGVLQDFRLGTPENTPPLVLSLPEEQPKEDARQGVIRKQIPTFLESKEPSITVTFVGESLIPIQELQKISEKDGSDLAEDLSAIVDFYMN